ncbi:hypothetical protein GV792_13640 [Nocardia cyriacigeorgica]|uniref:hypothetical protein n=1 Tax=Nocardia cyriacigeorgica TaxID=135487 RepID=UPI0013B94DD7|nr:hypothetical protein [Nocardia cyriacigeorgica]NEW51095.1 hypothetical protein [Nocardia cyriacigeorgica]
MTQTDAVSAGEAVRWLHEEGLSRLAGIAGHAAGPFGAFTVEVSTGTVTAHPVASTGAGSQVLTMSADELPPPAEPAHRLVVVGITTAQAILVIDLSAYLAVAISADDPVGAARSWVMQLLLDPEVTVTTNCAAVAIGDSPRCRRGFFPGGGAPIIHIDDKRPPVTRVTLDTADESADRLEVARDGSGEMYLGARFWSLNLVMTIDETTWAALAASLEAEVAAAPDSSPASPASVVAVGTAERPPEISR